MSELVRDSKTRVFGEEVNIVQTTNIPVTQVKEICHENDVRENI